MKHITPMMGALLLCAAGFAQSDSSMTLSPPPLKLANEPRFAQVDCNLSRVDGRQLVYNAKQRKDLLTDALATLSDLVRSPNAEVQRKAKERLGQLKSLAATVRD